MGQLETDYNKQIFDNYARWSTRSGVEVAGIDDGIKFLAFHDELHSGAIMAIKRSVVEQRAILSGK
ncbi:MAG TPA: hypothetical protein VIJ27_04530 [Mucilaginibacter sp.]